MDLSQHPPQLPPLVAGQQIRSGPYIVTVTEAMVAQRERENQRLYQAWLSQQQGMSNISPPDRFTPEFSDGKVRRKFIKKVFFILSIQLSFTTGIIAMFRLWDKATDFMIQTVWLTILAAVVFLVTFCTILCSENARRQFPGNVICMILLTLALSYMMAFVSIHYKTESVLIAAGATVVVTLVITFIATCCSFDLTKQVGWLCLITIIITVAVMILIITNLFTKIDNLQLIIGILGATLMSLYLFFDIQVLMGGRRIEMSPDEVVFATTQLYVDIIFLYHYLLMIVGHTNN